jgi:hypothetical protein
MSCLSTTIAYREGIRTTAVILAMVRISGLLPGAATFPGAASFPGVGSVRVGSPTEISRQITTTIISCHIPEV